jgi:adenylate cyclase
MKKWFRIYSLLLLLAFGYCLSGQTSSHTTDSLMQMVKNAHHDTDKINAMLALSGSINCTDSIRKKEYALDALQLAEKMTWFNGVMNANFLLGTSGWLCNHNYAVAINYYRKADSIALILHDQYNHARTVFAIAQQYVNLSQYIKAIQYYREGLALKTGPDLDISALSNVGAIYNHLGDLPNSLTYYDSSLKGLDQYIRTSKKTDIEDSLAMGALLKEIADVYSAMKQYEKALGNYSHALSLGQQTNDEWLQIQALIGMACTYKYQDKFETATDFYNRALAASRKLNETKPGTQILNYLANVYLEQKKFAEALSYGQQALTLVTANNHADMVPPVYCTLGLIYTQTKDYSKATNYLQKAITMSREAGALDIEKQALEAISHTYEASHQPALALEAYRQFIALRDSVYNIDKANELTRIDLQTGYERSKITDSITAANKVEVATIKTQKQKMYTYSGFAGLAAVLLLSFFIYRSYSQEKKANTVITKANKTISEQKQVAETLLLNILPADVAEELKTKGKVKAKLYDNVTVMFTDFVNFTAAGERLSPEELVEELHSCFEAFDEIMGRYKIEKIKTIGDGYVAVSGLPNANANHAADMIQAAIDIRDFVAERKARLGDNTFDIRIGINSGKLVAGIVGVKKFAYDIWGDAVNIAARMEQTGEQGKINISQDTWQLVKDNFACTYRGEIEAKNKGRLKMYFVEGRA